MFAHSLVCTELARIGPLEKTYLQDPQEGVGEGG